MKKTVLLDVDGTLLDTWYFIFDAVKYTANLHGYKYPPEETIKKAQGKSIIEFYQILYPDSDTELLVQTHIDYQKGIINIGKPFPGTIKTLKKIKAGGYSIAVISNRRRDSLLISLKETKLAEFFDLIVAADDVKNPKPHKEHILTALKTLKAKAKHSYMVGDLEVDILAGKNARVKTVGVTYGYAGEEIKKYEPDFIINAIEELPDIII